MADFEPRYELIPTTSREADFISEKHGFNSTAELAASLPFGANVLDVGSGASPFGKVVARLRPDISWTNFDYSYYSPKILEEVREDSPCNIEYVAGDATRLGESYAAESFDAIFSYWMMPHLSIENSEPAKEAARAMFLLAKIDAPISIGPVVSKGRAPSIRSFFVQGKAHKVVKSADIDADNFADTIVAKTKLPAFARFTQKT